MSESAASTIRNSYTAASSSNNNDDTRGGGGAAAYVDDNTHYPDYDQDQVLFERFLLEHTILVKEASRNRNNNDGDSESDDDDDIPTALTDGRVRRRSCYAAHLQRIRDRRPYDNDDDHTRNNSKTNTNTFTIPIPLSELVAWDAIQGGDLAERATRNTLRYHTLFATVLDRVLASLTVSTTTNNETDGDGEFYRVRDPMDILEEQRLAQQEAANAVMNNNTNNGNNNNNNNPFVQAGAMDDDNGNNNDTNTTPAGGATLAFPPLLLRRYELRILPLGRRCTLHPFVDRVVPTKSAMSTITPSSLRTLRAPHLGALCTVTGLCVQASHVQPSCQVATYACDVCGAEVYQVVQHQRSFLPLNQCPSPQCTQQGNGNNNNTANALHLQSRGSKFETVQECKVQELPHQVPMGHVPRSLTVVCRGNLTRQMTPGDLVTLDGIFLPQRSEGNGYRARTAGLIATTFLSAEHVLSLKKSYDDATNEEEDEEHGDDTTASTILNDHTRLSLTDQVHAVATGPDPVGRLASSLAPEIFGHADIKRSLLLQLVGGCTRTLPDGMRIRGDVNILLMGDPGVAKSQLLKHVASIAPRGVYTTGKGSSGVGLTAAVTKDAVTGEMALEGGALVLADRGICCIDEFDKMDESDRTAIHEVMEQQTVSIAKAGIVATLNARSSVLAAANPLYGRYHRNKSLSENINLPNSLLSRFDLLFLILDVANVDKDMALARHVTFVHQNEGLSRTKKGRKDGNDDSDDEDDDCEGNHDDEEDDDSGIVSAAVLRAYISRARRHHPVMPPDVAPYVVEAYVSLRQQQAPSSTRRKSTSDQTVLTARQLLSILRLSQGLARLRFSDYVAREDVDEAIRLTHQSKASLTEHNDDATSSDGRRTNNGGDVMSRIYNILRDYATTVAPTDGGASHRGLELSLCEAMVLRKGFTAQQLQSCLQEYEALDVLHVNESRTHVYLK